MPLNGFGRLLDQPNTVGAVGIQDNYSYPTAADVKIMKGETHEIHLICDVADPNGSTNYDAAPIGSLYIWILAGSVDLLIKTDATTWTAT